MAAQYVLYQSLRYDPVSVRIVGWRFVRQHNIVNHLQCSHQLCSSTLLQYRPARFGDFYRQKFSRSRALTQASHVLGQQRVEMTRDPADGLILELPPSLIGR